MDIDSVYPLLIPVGVVIATLAFWYVQRRRSKANFAALVSKLELQIDKHSGELRATGERRGRTLTVFTYTTGFGKSKRRWVAVAAHVKDVGRLTFSLKQRVPIIDLILQLFRKCETKVGDQAFDKKWVMVTNRPDYMSAAVLPEMREKMSRLGGNFLSDSSYKLDLYTLQYAQQGSFANAKLCARLAEQAELVCDLADVMEVGEEMKKSKA